MFKIFDTQVAAHILDENLTSKSLKYLAEIILNVPKEQIKKYDDVDKNNLFAFSSYACNDAIWTYQLYQKFAPEIERQNLGHVFYGIEMPFQFALVELAINGMKVDVSLAEQMTYEVRHLYYTLEKEMLDMFGGTWYLKYNKRNGNITCKPTINFNSSDQVIPLIESLGFEITERTKPSKKYPRGQKSFGKKTKERLKGKHKFIDLLIKFGKVEKLLNSFLYPFKEFIDEDGKIRSSFHNTIAVTGRLSSSNPNVEQLPKNNDIANIRNLYMADSDYTFIVADYSGQELRILGEESQDPVLIDAFAKGLDLHQITADEVGRNRDDAKSVNFGVIYGKTAYGFSRDFNTTEQEAQKFVDGYFKKYQRVQQRIERCRQQVSLNGYVTNLSGRKRRFPEFKRLNKWGKARYYRQAFNFLIQSYGADVIKVAAFEIIKNKSLKLVNIVHDEIVVMCKKDYVKQGIDYIRKCMVNAIPISIPWEVKIEIGERYGEAK